MSLASTLYPSVVIIPSLEISSACVSVKILPLLFNIALDKPFRYFNGWNYAWLGKRRQGPVSNEVKGEIGINSVLMPTLWVAYSSLSSVDLLSVESMNK
jgi:hypothetical protein